ncbi:MAG TPA: polysaccharide biosynthesis tyrosine autokinase [Solirubrobacteraceae bacterium]|nr:polysaccharide biosynthesis tyrosine autokinase [Solirubrobacteraceae bacterium]
MQQASEGLNLERALRVLLRRAPLILLCAVVAAGAAFGFSKHQTKKYTATAALAFDTNPLSEQITGIAPNTSATGLLTQQANDLESVKLGDMAAKAAGLLGRGLTAEDVRAKLSISGAGESGVVDVSATAASPHFAAEIANAYSGVFVKEQETANRAYLRSALALVNKQLAGLSRAQRVGQDGLELQDRAQTLTLLAELQYGNVQIAQEASTPTTPSSPKTSRNTAIGGILGLFIGLGLAFVFEQLDRRIQRPEDLEAIYQVPLLGTVPESGAISTSARPNGSRAALLPPAEAEAFGLIRAHLRFFNIDRELRTVLITSAAPGDGKTTLARQMAEAAARIGSRVLLLEVDLRYPTLAKQFGIQHGPGLADVLIGAVSMDEAARSVVLEAAPGEGVSGRTLDVLTAGSMQPPNPAELIESRAMDAALGRARSMYDLVVIDTPPLTAVSDAFPLLCKVDGIVVIGWVGRSRRDAAANLHQILASSGAPLLGVVANGVESAGGTSAYVSKAPAASISPNGVAPKEGVESVIKA